MSLADELSKLDELRTRGVINDEEFQRAKARVLDGGAPAAAAPPPAASAPIAALNRFRRSRADRWIGGVCGGLGQLTGVEAWIWRLVLTVLLCFGGTGAVLYILLWIFVPAE